MSIKNEEIVNAVSNMSVLELLDLVKDIEKKFNISASSINFGESSVKSNANHINEAKVEEKTLFTIVMTSYGEDKINIIKKVRTILNLGLKEAKDFVENLPAVIKKDIPKIEADTIKNDLETSGAKIELK